MDHPILEVVAERHDAHLVDDMEAARTIKVENRVERSGRKQFVKTICERSGRKQFAKNTDLTKFYEPGMAVEEILIVDKAAKCKCYKSENVNI